MLFEELKIDNCKVGIKLKEELWLLGEIIKDICNASSIDVFGSTLYLDGIDSSKKSISLNIDTYETKYKAYNLEGELLKYNGITITLSYPNKKIYDLYSAHLEKRILTINYMSFHKNNEVPFGFDEARVIHCIGENKKVSEIKRKYGYQSFTRLKNISDEIV